jgi:RND family efflux transporter MFP subunit
MIGTRTGTDQPAAAASVNLNQFGRYRQVIPFFGFSAPRHAWAAVCPVLMVAALVIGGCGSGTGGSDAPPGPKAAKPKGKPAHLVETVVVERTTLVHRIERTGTLRAQREAKIFNQEEGGILAVLVHEGDAVDKDQVLVRLDDRILTAQLDQATARLRQAQADLRRLQRLAEKQLVSEETVARAETALEVARAEQQLLKTRVDYMRVQAPFAGVISRRFVNAGDVAPKHTHLLTIVDPSSLITDVAVSELVLPRLGVGDPVTVRIDALGTAVHGGRILRIYPTVDPSTRRGRIEVVLNPVPDGASAGQFCRVTLTAQAADRLVAPLAAVRHDSQGEYVFRLDDDNSVTRTPIRSGLRQADRVEVLTGLQAGDRVVVSGFLGLDSGMTVKPVGDGGARPRATTPAVQPGRERNET